MGLSVKYFDYPLQFRLHQKEYSRIIEDTFMKGAYLFGDDTHTFEENFARYAGTKFAIGVGNCTDALLLSLMAAGIGPGDEVISVAHTFVATIEVIKFVGAKPVLIDIADDHNMDVGLVKSAITEKTKAIVPVSLNGRVCDRIDLLLDLAREHNLAVIEDAAQALGGKYKGRKAGTFGLAGCFSFYPAKLLGAFGDAGAVITDSEEFADKVRSLRNHGRGKGTDIERWGLNCRMDNVHAAILNFKLGKLDEWITRRRRVAEMYDQRLQSLSQLVLPAPPNSESEHYDVFQNYEIEADRRDELVGYLSSKGVDTLLPWGGKAVHQFSGLGFGEVTLPKTEALFRRVVMLPMYPELTDEKIDYVCESIKEFYALEKR